MKNKQEYIQQLEQEIAREVGGATLDLINELIELKTS
jgi:hypothetical protein